MNVKCPKCGKKQSKDEIEKTNKGSFKQYKKESKKLIEERVQSILREGFKKKLEEIDKKYSSLDCVHDLRDELSQLQKELRILNGQKVFKEERSRVLYYEIETLKSHYTYYSLNYPPKALKDLTNKFIENTTLEYQNTLQKLYDTILTKNLNNLSTKYKMLQKKATSICNEAEAYKNLFYQKQEEVEDLNYKVLNLKRALYDLIKQKEEIDKRNDIIKKALEET